MSAAVGDLCAVCGDRATKLRYSHYGATSCFSCRAFFRRAIEKGSHQGYSCREARCEVRVATRKKCPFCRFRKCQSVGMTHAKVKVSAVSPDDQVEDLATQYCHAMRTHSPLEKEFCLLKPGLSRSSMSPMTFSVTNDIVLNSNPYPMTNDDSMDTHFGQDVKAINPNHSNPTYRLVQENGIPKARIVSPQYSNNNDNQDDVAKARQSSSHHYKPRFRYMQDKEEDGAKVEAKVTPYRRQPVASVFTLEDSLLVQEVVRLDRANNFYITDALSTDAMAAIKSFLCAACTGSALDHAAISWAYTVGIKKLARFAQVLGDFAGLSDVGDKKALLLSNLDPMFNIRIGHFFTCDADDFLEQLETLDIFDVSFFKSIAGCFQPISRMRWDQFFSTPWATSPAHERKFEALMSRLKLLRLDRITVSLFNVVALLETDEQAAYAQKDALKAAQSKYTGLLYRYLRHCRGLEEADRMFEAYMAMMGSLREMADIMKNKTIKVSGGAWPQVVHLI